MNETRDWPPKIPKRKLPADVLIHASRSTEEFYMLDVIKLKVEHPQVQALTIEHLNQNLGKIISLVKLVDYVQMTQQFINKQNFAELSCGCYAVGKWAWVKGKVFPLPEKIPYLGKPWLEDASNEIILNVKQQLGI
ncbi:MAG TPA: hypothetical protein VK203_06150 [Nostocaceae cyanobacterium]|nr:hypothetical protein [Nostocaceae cyanobacterium]